MSRFVKLSLRRKAVCTVEGNKFGLYMLDKELAARTYTQASPLATANA